MAGSGCVGWCPGVAGTEGCVSGRGGGCLVLHCGGAAGCNWARLRRSTKLPVLML